MPSENIVTSADSAVDSLERMALELEKGGLDNPLALKAVLAWGWHAVVLLSYMRLQPQREEFDAWIWGYLDEGSPELAVDRDAHWEERQRLSLLEILDIFSAVDLPLLKPEFYQGWTDRTVRCQTLRRQIVEIVGSGLDAEQRQDLPHRGIANPVAGPSPQNSGPWCHSLACSCSSSRGPEKRAPAP